VSQPKLEGSVLGSYRQYRKEGVPFDVNARVLRCECRRAPPEILRILGIDADEAVYEVERVRFVQRRPVSLQVSYLPARLCPGLESRDLSGAHLYRSSSANTARSSCGPRNSWSRSSPTTTWPDSSA
jgi:DNA-binding GntR family transcriptional regulator